jgi:hypothetical protein
MIKRLWKDACVVQRVAVALNGRGRLAVAALPLARWAKRALKRQ